MLLIPLPESVHKNLLGAATPSLTLNLFNWVAGTVTKILFNFKPWVLALWLAIFNVLTDVILGCPPVCNTPTK